MSTASAACSPSCWLTCGPDRFGPVELDRRVDCLECRDDTLRIFGSGARLRGRQPHFQLARRSVGPHLEVLDAALAQRRSHSLEIDRLRESELEYQPAREVDCKVQAANQDERNGPSTTSADSTYQ